MKLGVVRIEGGQSLRDEGKRLKVQTASVLFQEIMYQCMNHAKPRRQESARPFHNVALFALTSTPVSSILHISYIRIRATNVIFHQCIGAAGM